MYLRRCHSPESGGLAKFRVRESPSAVLGKPRGGRTCSDRGRAQARIFSPGIAVAKSWGMTLERLIGFVENG